MTVQQIRDDYLSTLAHVDQVIPKLMGNTGKGGIFNFPDVHKLTEGLFLSAWTYWEGFLGNLLWYELATDAHGVVRRDVQAFRKVGGPFELASYVLNHPDHPDKFVDWSDYATVAGRADRFLGPGHRFVTPLPQSQDLAYLKRIRNAIAHRSDKAWQSFRDMVVQPPFNLLPNQRRGLTAGRFLSSHQWNGVSVMHNGVAVVRAAAHVLVP